MVKMAFLIPIPTMRQKYSKKASIQLINELPFVHYLNASITYCPYRFENEAIPFLYTSKYKGREKRGRMVGITPYLLKYRIGKNTVENYAIALIATLDKHFHANNGAIQEDEWYTPFDLVYFRKAWYEAKEGLSTNIYHGEQNLHDWLISIICDVSGERRDRVDISGMISSTNITVLAIDENLNDVKQLNSEVSKQYYAPTHYRTIDDFLSVNFDADIKDPSTTDAMRFIYGVLRGNENFMQLHHNSVLRVLKDFYSNNYMEGYWAVEDGILSVKVGCPFVNLRDDEKHERVLSNSLNKGNDCFMELCVLSMLDRELVQFSRRHSKMKSHEIDLHRARIAEYFNERILNVWELDHRLDYFMKRFKLAEKFKRVLKVTVPRANAHNVIFSRTGVIIGWVIALISLITTIIVSKH